MNFKSKSGYSLIEIGVALIIVGIFMVCSVTLLSASSENYRRIEQRSIALMYAMQAIEAIQLDNNGITLEEVKTRARYQNNMEIETDVSTLPPKDGKSYSSKVMIVTANVNYKTKSSEAGSLTTLTLQTLMVND